MANPSSSRETPPINTDNGDANKLWSPHKFSQCNGSPCETDIQASRKMSSQVYMQQDNVGGYHQISYEMNLPPPYPATISNDFIAYGGNDNTYNGHQYHLNNNVSLISIFLFSSVLF